MSFDVIILRPTDLSENDLYNVIDVLDIGDHETVIKLLDLVFPGCANGSFSAGESYSIESTQNGNPVTSVHLTLRFGTAWSEKANRDFLTSLSKLCNFLKAVAFAVSDNSRITPP